MSCAHTHATFAGSLAGGCAARTHQMQIGMPLREEVKACMIPDRKYNPQYIANNTKKTRRKSHCGPSEPEPLPLSCDSMFSSLFNRIIFLCIYFFLSVALTTNLPKFAAKHQDRSQHPCTDTQTTINLHLGCISNIFKGVCL